jgi:hypothetical protein
MDDQVREQLIKREQEAAVRTNEFFHRELSKPRLVANALEQLLAAEKGGGPHMRASEDHDWAVANALESAIQGLIAFTQEQAPGWTIQKLVSTLALQITCTISPGAQYNGIDYSETWQNYDMATQQHMDLPDFGAVMITQHLSSLMANPVEYDMGHIAKPIGEHDFEYELPILPRGSDLSPEFTDAPDPGDFAAPGVPTYLDVKPEGPSFDQFLVGFIRDMRDNDPDMFRESVNIIESLCNQFEGGYTDDGQLKQSMAEAFYVVFPEPDADAEHPAGR